MIFNKTVLKRLMKTAYKGAGLLVANNKGKILLEGGWWIAEINEDAFPKEAKAALVELTGCLPEEGECFRSTSAGNQVEMPKELHDISIVKENGIFEQEPFLKTKIIMDFLTPIRIYQQGQIIAPINELIPELLENPSLQEWEDGGTEGPFNRGEVYYWFSSTCSLVAGGIKIEKPETVKILKELEKINLAS